MVDMKIFLIIALILFSTKAFSMFMRKIHLPQVIGALLAGVLLGPAVFNIAQPNEMLSFLAELGVIFLLFSAGMETDFKQLRESIKASLLISVLGVVAALGGGFLVASFLGFSTFQSFFIGVIIASMSTSITVEALSELGKLKSKSGTAILGASLIDDIVVIVILAVAMSLGKGIATGESDVSIFSILEILGRAGLFFAFAFIAGMGMNKLFAFMYKKYGTQKRLSIFAIAYCLIMAFLAEQFGLADITGAYLAGIAFCNTRCVEFLETQTHSLSYMLFTPIFLANIGLHTSFVNFDNSMILFTVLIVLVSVLSKFIGCGLGAKISKFTNRESLQVGMGMVPRGEVSFIVISKGIAANEILKTTVFPGDELYPSIIIVVLITVLFAPLLLKTLYSEK